MAAPTQHILIENDYASVALALQLAVTLEELQHTLPPIETSCQCTMNSKLHTSGKIHPRRGWLIPLPTQGRLIDGRMSIPIIAIRFDMPSRVIFVHISARDHQAL